MKYPLIINGSVSGSFSVEQDGLYTVLEAESPGSRAELVRLWVHGGGKCAYLGVMQPWSGGLYLRRRLSRTEAASLPAEPEYASDTGGEPKTETGEQTKENTQKAAPPESPETGESADGLLWLQKSDGTLTAHDGISGLVAIPAELRREAEGTVIKNLNGRSYMIFRY